MAAHSFSVLINGSAVNELPVYLKCIPFVHSLCVKLLAFQICSPSQVDNTASQVTTLLSFPCFFHGHTICCFM